MAKMQFRWNSPPLLAAILGLLGAAAYACFAADFLSPSTFLLRDLTRAHSLTENMLLGPETLLQQRLPGGLYYLLLFLSNSLAGIVRMYFLLFFLGTGAAAIFLWKKRGAFAAFFFLTAAFFSFALLHATRTLWNPSFLPGLAFAGYCLIARAEEHWTKRKVFAAVLFWLALLSIHGQAFLPLLGLLLAWALRKRGYTWFVLAGAALILLWLTPWRWLAHLMDYRASLRPLEALAAIGDLPLLGLLLFYFRSRLLKEWWGKYLLFTFLGAAFYLLFGYHYRYAVLWIAALIFFSAWLAPELPLTRRWRAVLLGSMALFGLLLFGWRAQWPLPRLSEGRELAAELETRCGSDAWPHATLRLRTQSMYGWELFRATTFAIAEDCDSKGFVVADKKSGVVPAVHLLPAWLQERFASGEIRWRGVTETASWWIGEYAAIRGTRFTNLSSALSPGWARQPADERSLCLDEAPSLRECRAEIRLLRRGGRFWAEIDGPALGTEVIAETGDAMLIAESEVKFICHDGGVKSVTLPAVGNVGGWKALVERAQEAPPALLSPFAYALPDVCGEKRPREISLAVKRFYQADYSRKIYRPRERDDRPLLRWKL